MEKLLTKAQTQRNKRDEEVRAKYAEYIAVGSLKMAVYAQLAEEYGISQTTVANIVNGYNYKKRKRKYNKRNLRKTRGARQPIQ